MELGILVGMIRGELNKIKKLAVPPDCGQDRELFDCNLEAQKTFNELDAVLVQLEEIVAKNPKQEATKNHVTMLTDFLDKRWQRIKNTDLIYPILTDHDVTKLCVDVAQLLAKQRELVDKRNYLALLMPTIKKWHNEVSHTDLWTLYLHNILPDDTNTFCVQLGYIDLNMDPTNTKLEMSMVIDGQRVYLNPSEVDRVYHHSPVISEYYSELKTQHQLLEEIKRGEKAAQDHQETLKKTQERINVARDNMVRALRDEHYSRLTVRASYGKASAATLQNNFMKDTTLLFNNREQLFHYMSSHLEPSQWQGFLAKMSDDDAFQQLILQGESIKELPKLMALFKVEDKNKKYNYEGYNKAAAYCLVEAYSRLRIHEGEFTSLAGYVFSFIKRVFPKDIKNKIVEIMRKYLIGEKDPECCAEKYFFHGELTPEIRAKFSNEEIDWLNAMKNSRCGNIYACICELLVAAPVLANENQTAVKLSSM